MKIFRLLGWLVLLVCLTPGAHAAEPPPATAAGNSYFVPEGWSVRDSGSALVLSAPERNSHVAIVETGAKDPDAALTAAWAAYDANAKRALRRSADRPVRNGWAQIRGYIYDAAANEQRLVYAQALRHGERWTVALADLDAAVAEKRDAHIGLIFNGLRPKGYTPETYAGLKAHALDAARIATLTQFVESARQAFDVPGVALGIVQDGKVVFAGGFGVRALGKPDTVDADTLFHAASALKPLTTLMLAKLVDAGKFSWETPATQVLPAFKLADADLTRRVLIKHLACACTGIPRQDFEWVFASEGKSPAHVIAALATMQPTAKLGEAYQYSNPMAAAAGYAGGHALHPDRELGAAYDAAMQSLVFDPLGMAATTFDYARAERGNHAAPHGEDISGRTVRISQAFNRTGIAMRPDGGAFSSVNDLLRFVQMEIDEGRLPDGRRYIGKTALLARREPQVARGGEGQGYGIGLKIDRGRGTPMLSHGGSMAGYQAELWWLPEHRVGAVLLANADAGAYLRGLVARRLLEVLFDANEEAPAQLATLATAAKESAAADRQRLTVPADPTSVAALATRYRSATLGDIDVVRNGATTTFDFGAWHSEVATRKDPDGTTVFVTSSASVAGYEFIVATRDKRRALVLRDAQHEYVFEER